MSDFTAKIDSYLDISKAESTMQSFLNKYKNEPIKIDVQINPNSIDTGNLGKQIQNQFSNVGTSIGKTFTKNMETAISNTNIDKLVNRLNAKGISKDIVLGAEKSLNTLTKAGIQINKIQEVFSDDNLISLKIDGVDQAENAVSIVDKLNKKTKEWTSTTTYTTSFKEISKDAENASKKLLTLDEIKTRLFKAQGNVGSLQAQFGNVDKFSQDFNELGVSIKNALSQVDNGDASQLSVTLSEIEAKVKTLTTSTREWHKVNQTDADIASSARKQLENTEKAINKQKELQSALAAFKKQNATLFDPKSENYSSSIVAEFNEVENAINRISSVSSAKVASNMFSGLRASVKTETTNIVSDIDKIQNKFTTVQSKFNSIQSAFGKSSQNILGTSGYNQIQAYLNQATSAANRFNAEISNSESANLDRLNADMEEFISLTNRATSEYNKLNAPASVVKQQNTLNEFQIWMNKNSKAFKVGGTRYNSIISSLQGNLTGGQLEEAISQIKSFKTEMELTGNVGRSFPEEIGRGFKKIGQFAGTYGLIQRFAFQVPRAISQAVINIDDSVTQLRKVSDATDLQISNYFDEAAASAKKYGQTISDVIATTADWSRLGYNFEDSKLLSDITTLYQNVGDNMTQESASSSMISTLQGFQMQADEAMHIVDAYNEVGNNFAIGSDGIGEAVQRSASSMYAANNTFEQTIGLITAANTVVQDPDSVGTAFKTKFLRNCLYVQKCA